MPVAALVVYGVWFALTFGLRTFIQRRRTGSRGFKGLGGRPGSLEWGGRSPRGRRGRFGRSLLMSVTPPG